ncbi:hypothetical protein [Brevundimonas sp.]|uniref:hypothetical protein n=1 Tax=Brevundimonas sp. TaxID=1871086 RepID=UPI003AF65BCA
MTAAPDSLDLSGRWAGVFFYPDGAPDDFVPTSFLAILDEHGSHFTGQTTERDYWSSAGSDLHAVLEGQRTGLSLAFTKIPDGGRITIEYVGELTPDGHTIRGRWHILGNWSGTFEMRRQAAAGDDVEACASAYTVVPASSA